MSVNKKYAEIDVQLSYEMYKAIKKMYPKMFMKSFLYPSIFIVVFGCFALFPVDEDPELGIGDVLLVDVILIGLWLIILLLIMPIIRKLSYKIFLKKHQNEAYYTLSFYDEYIKKKTSDTLKTVKYSDIKKYKDTDFVLYLILNDKEVLSISKLLVNADVVNLIKYSVDKAKNKELINKDVTDYVILKNSINDQYSLLSNIIFVVTLVFPVWFSLFFWQWLSRINGAYGMDTFKYTWVAFLVLPIPIVSIVLGIMFNKKGGSCTKNIVAGFIIAIIVVFIGMLSLLAPYLFGL